LPLPNQVGKLRQNAIDIAGAKRNYYIARLHFGGKFTNDRISIRNVTNRVMTVFGNCGREPFGRSPFDGRLTGRINVSEPHLVRVIE
jgi:hypothetical protein